MKRFCGVLIALLGIGGAFGFAVRNSPASSPAGAISASPLFQQPSVNAFRKRQNLIFVKDKSLSRRRMFARTLHVQIARMAGKFRRSFVILAASMLVWFGAAGINSAPAHASTAEISVPESSTGSAVTSPLEQIVDRYVKDHMFDDDVYEPVESIYREAINDKVKGTHLKALSEITSSVLGQDGMKVEKTSSSSGVGEWLMGAIAFLQRKGFSESTAIILLTGTLVVAGPTIFLLGTMMVASQSKRNIQGVMKKRYGDTYS